VLVPVGVLAAYPDLISILMNGRAVTWEQLTYFAAPMSITLLLAALAGVLTAIARICVLRKHTTSTNSGRSSWSSSRSSGSS
jgi:uncharacterized integral membrane protein